MNSNPDEPEQDPGAPDEEPDMVESSAHPGLQVNSYSKLATIIPWARGGCFFALYRAVLLLLSYSIVM